VREDVQSLLDEVMSNRRHLHMYPEIALNTPNTEAFIVEKLKSYGFEIVEQGIAEHGVVGYLWVNDEPAIGFRSDMDALPMFEENDVSYKSTNDYAHMCGHDGHMAALLGLAKYLSAHKDKLKTSVCFVFQPGEEGPGGSKIMIEEGLFKKYPMRCIFGTHVMGEVAEGVIASRSGAMMARNGEVKVKIKGKGTHGATPQLGKDAIVAGAAFVNQIQTIISRSISPLNSGVVSIGSFHGGSAENIIAEIVQMEGTIRSFDDETYALIKERLISIGKGIAYSYDVDVDVEIIDYYLVVENDEALFNTLKNVIGDEFYEVEPKMAAEDFSFYQKEVPGLFYYVGTGSDTYNQHLHNARYNFDEKVLLNVIETNLRLLEALEAIA
ncbi:M20 family metallopeptidase, partial [Breznakia sp. OttesenSCG-928-G09]|nr:M20 family metallopeptidase [Breznakia sp. OttesenSCG-928-G09]